MTLRQEIITVLITLAWIGGCANQGVKAHKALSDDVAMARLERECIPAISRAEDIYADAKRREAEFFEFGEAPRP